ncbi:MAG TPA: PAS domain S-box protein, partial [Thermosynechococcaceae cyanobacterium]
MFKFSSLRTRLIASLLGVALVPLVLLTLTHFVLMGQVFRQNADQALFAAATRTALSLDNFLRTGLDTVRAEAQLPGIGNYLRLPAKQRSGSSEETQVTELLRALLKRDSSNVLSYALLDLEGTNVLGTEALDLRQSKAGADYFRQPLATGSPYASPIYLPASPEGLPGIYFSSPVWNSVGAKVGVLAVRYSATLLQQLVAQSENLAGSQSFATLLDENYIRIAHSARPELVFRSIVPLPPEKVEVLQAQSRLPQGSSTELSTNLPQLEEALRQSNCDSNCPPIYLTITLSAEPRSAEPRSTEPRSIVRVAITRLQSQPWFVLFAQPQQVFLAPLMDEIRLTAGLTAIVVFGVLGVAIAMGRWLTKPLVYLSNQVSHFTAGNLATRAQITSKDEIGALASNFNALAQQVSKLLQGLEDRTHELESSQRTTTAVSELAKATLDSDRLLQEAVKLVQERFQVDFVQIYLWEEAADALLSYASAGVISPGRLPTNRRVKLGDDRSLVAIAAQGQQMQSTGNLHSLNDSAAPRIASRFYQPVSEVAVPLLSRGKLLGILDVQDQQEFRFSRSDLDTLSLLSSQIATALGSAQLFSELQKTESRFRTIFEDAPIGMSIASIDQGRIIQVNKAYSIMTGYTAAEAKQLSFHQITPPEDLNKDINHLERLLAGETDSYQLEKRLIRKDQTLIWINLTATLLNDAQGKPRYSLGMIENITDRREANATLRRSEGKYRG